MTGVAIENADDSHGIEHIYTRDHRKMTRSTIKERETAYPGGVAEVFSAFLKLGLTSFGGPIAHLGYFRTEFVERRRWLDDRAYSDLVALCQFLPGPASSQVGMALGLGRAGWLGLLAAWVGFTLPSAIALILFAYGITQYQWLAQSGWVHGLKIAAVAIVAQAVWGMGRSLCPDRRRATLAILAALLTLALPSTLGQVTAIIAAGLIGRFGLKTNPTVNDGSPDIYPVSRKLAAAALLIFTVLLFALPSVVVATDAPVVALVDGVYRAGALVFGGGHVVLPLLESTVVSDGFVSHTDFLAGYGAAQAVPGPLFTFAAYLGTVAKGALGGWIGGLILLGTIFLPALLVLVGTLPFWQALRHRAGIRSAMAGINAGVVGILLAALYDPVWTSAIHNTADFGLALAAFGLLVYGRVPPAVVVLLTGATGYLGT